MLILPAGKKKIKNKSNLQSHLSGIKLLEWDFVEDKTPDEAEGYHSHGKRIVRHEFSLICLTGNVEHLTSQQLSKEGIEGREFLAIFIF